MPNTGAKDRKRNKRKLNADLKKYGRTKKQIQRKARELARKVKLNGKL